MHYNTAYIKSTIPLMVMNLMEGICVSCLQPLNCNQSNNKHNISLWYALGLCDDNISFESIAVITFNARMIFMQLSIIKATKNSIFFPWEWIQIIVISHLNPTIFMWKLSFKKNFVGVVYLSCKTIGVVYLSFCFSFKI